MAINLSGVSCPTKSLCVAVGGREGTLAFSEEPTGGAESWRWTRLPDPPSGALQAVSCASASLCALVTYDGWVFVSTDPGGGSGAWTGANVNAKGQQGATHLISVSCPSPSFCAAVSGGSHSPNAGRVLTSSDPASGDWQTAELGSQLDLRSISCGTPSFCIAVARGGHLFSSTDPDGGASAWQPVANPAGGGDLEGASCVATVLCAVGNMTGNVLTSTDPSTGASWKATNAGGSVQITGVSCPDVGHCLAVDNNGDVMISTDPTGAASAWHFENLMPFTADGQPHNAFFGASCPTASFCALVGRDGRIFTSTDPFSSAAGGTTRHGGRKISKRPQTILLFAERFWAATHTRHRRVRARFRFYSPTKARGFECRRDRGPYRRCRSPLRYWAGFGRHVLRVRAIGPTGLRGPVARKRFRISRPRSGAVSALALPAPIATTQAAQRNAFALFRGEPEGLPGSFGPNVRAALRSRSYGLNPALAQHSRPNPDEAALWAIPGRGTICIYVSPGDRRPPRLACAPTGAAADSGLALDYRGATTFGLVPDDARAVRLYGNPRPVPIEENAFAARGRGLERLIPKRSDSHRHFHDKVVHPPATCPRSTRSIASESDGPQYEPEVVC